MSAKQDQIIEYSLDDGATWHHGKTIDGQFANDPAMMGQQRGHVRAWVRDEHGDVGHVATRVLNADDMRAEVNRPPSPGKFYAVRQARTRIVGSRLMSRDEADTELARRRDLCQTRNATLDGYPAVISGARNDFATVATLSGARYGIEFAWATVARIVARNAEFKS